MLNVSDFTSLCSMLSDTVYIGSFRNAIHTGTNQNYYDLQIGQAFIESWRQFKLGNNVSSNRAAHKLTQEIQKIFGFSELEINPSADGNTLNLIIDDQSYTLAEVGAGLAQFVIVLAFIAVRKPSMVLIDEPELNLHPLLQQDLMASIAAHCGGPTLFSTHNLGLARAITPHIHVCKKEGDHSKLRPLTAHPRLAELLGELSYGGYQELGFSKLLLVEGPHDVTTIRELLRILGKDVEIVIMPLGGASMINESAGEQLEELRRITPNIKAIVDSERVSATDPPADNVQGFERACASAQIPCHVLERRAIENYLPENAIQVVKGAHFRALGPYEKLSDASPTWSKAEDSQIAPSHTTFRHCANGLGPVSRHPLDVRPPGLKSPRTD